MSKHKSEPRPRPILSNPAPQPLKSKRNTDPIIPGKHAVADGLGLRSYEIGALPLLKRILERMQIGTVPP